jgi:hypothetical protein
MPSRPGTRNRLKTTLPVRYGKDFVTLLDGRCRLSREVRERLQALTDDLGGELSHQQRSMCKRAIWLELMVEHEEARIGEGGGVDGALHTQLITSLVGIYRLLGVRRVARQTRLSDYLRRGED